ncbi:MAG: 1-deoxy-D-xylulose-5-phosphate synthase [Planctomycetes bacterium]|nr:1-deoxy-D-xylulose-5-phosphate synthase [Planctomycetota bacterium]
MLSRVRGPEDIRMMSLSDLKALAQEMRNLIRETVSTNSGHLASNLGVVELAIALHYCLDFRTHRLIWDVGHQAYAHKLLTGRPADFKTLRQLGGLSGFPNKKESEFDLFTTGHAGTAISCAQGLALADEKAGRNNKAVAVVGDGCMGAGMSFEALNHAGGTKSKNLLVILNDNSMAISGTVGAMSAYLSRMRQTTLYNEFKKEIHGFIERVPVFGPKMEIVFEHVKDAVKRSMVAGQIFEDLGFRYFGPVDGHNLEEMIDTLRDVKALDGPVLLHVLTEKGKGFGPAVQDPERYHSPKTFCAETGVILAKNDTPDTESFTNVFSRSLIEIAEEEPKLVAITAAMPSGTGLLPFQEKFPDRFFDVGICEQHALGMAAGMAVGGAKPVAAIYSTFLQRAFDQVFHEVCLQDLPVVLAVDRAGVVGRDGPTHNGVFDIAYLRCLPNIVVMAPSNGPELAAMLRFAVKLEKPCAIRYPRAAAPTESWDAPPLDLGKAAVLKEGPDGAILAYGAMVGPALAAAEWLAHDGLNVMVANMRFAKPLDETLLQKVLAEQPFCLTVEDHTVRGGFGSAVLEAAADGGRARRVRLLGLPDEFIEHGPRDVLLKRLGLDAQGIASAVRAAHERVETGTEC